MLRSFRLVPGLNPDETSSSSLHSLSNTNALYCRAVTGNCAKNTVTPYLDNFVALYKFVNLRQLIMKFAEIDQETITGLPRNQPARNSNPSQACFSTPKTIPAWRN
jgi:hypothetical protein